MKEQLDKILIVSIFLLLTHTLLGQRQDTTYQAIYKVSKDVLLDIDLNHADLMISTSEDDTIRISTNISLIPNNSSTPFNGISSFVQQKNTGLIILRLLVGKEIQPNNELKAFCQVTLPKTTNIKLKSRYSHISIGAPFGSLNSTLDYSTLKALTLNSKVPHLITGSYSELTIDSINSTLQLTGTNLILKSKAIKKLETNSKFSTLQINHVTRLNSQSYSDKFILGKADSIHITGDYSSLIIKQLSNFFQSDLTYGTLIIEDIAAHFSTLNIANTYVNTQLNFADNSSYSLNADMRYCELKTGSLSFEKIASPGGNLYQGIVGKQKHPKSKISIVSSFGDVIINNK